MFSQRFEPVIISSCKWFLWFLGIIFLSTGIFSTYVLHRAASSTDIVIARYKESVDYLSLLPVFQEFRRVYIYNKGPNDLDISKLPSNTIIISLPNVGCEGHTHLHHMLSQREDLGEHTLFLPGSWYQTSLKTTPSFYMMRLLFCKDFLGFYDIESEPIHKKFQDFSLTQHQHSSDANKSMNSSLSACADGPFGVWYEKNFGDRKSYITTYCGILLISKERILSHNPNVYERLIGYLNTERNPEAGHFMERSWGVLFAKSPYEM